MGKQSDAWKDLERVVAKKLGGKRVIRGDDFSQSRLDVECDKWAVDCKWRTNLATVKWYKKLCKDNDKIYPGENKIPILVIKEKGMRGELVVISLDDFIRVVNSPEYVIKPHQGKDEENE